MNRPYSIRAGLSWRLLLLLLVFAVLWFSNIEHRKLIVPDEGRYAEIPREMVASGDWVTPRLNGLKYFEKPPLQYWATAAAYEAFGEHQWTSRLWAALTGFAGVLFVWFAGTRLFGREAGAYAGILLGGSALYVLMSHVNTLDIGVTFFISLGIISLLLAQQMDAPPQSRRYWMYLAWVALALSVLSKGLMGIILPGAALFLYSVFQRDLVIWKRMHWGMGLLLFFAVVSPWFYLVMKANPQFFQFFFIHEHFERFTTKVHGRYQPWYYFVPVLLFGMLPWTLLMFETVLRSWKDSAYHGRAFNPERFLLIWAVFIYLFFSVSDSKLPSYLLPMFPALALLMGKRLAAMDKGRLFWLLVPILPLMLAGLAGAPFISRSADTPLQHEMYSAYSVWLIAAAAIWLATVVVALLWIRRDKKMAAVLALALGTLVASLFGTSGYNTISKERSAWLVADAIRSEIKPDVPFYSVEDYEQTLPFYLKHTFTLVAYQDEMAFGIGREPQRWIPDIDSFIKVWNEQPAAYAYMPLHTYRDMQSRGLPMKILYEDTLRVVVSKP